jgi:biopolymer transport protein ExbD
MQFTTRRRKQTPTVIIISLIDVLIVVLIFLMVTTTYKEHPAIKLALPESKQSAAGASETPLIITIPKKPPIYLNRDEISLDRLQAKLTEAASRNPQATLAIRADAEAPFGTIVKVMDAAKAANIKSVSAFTKNGVEQE